MMIETQERQVQPWTETVELELYEDLMNRYERVLLFAGQLQEKVRQQKLLQEKNGSLQQENERLKKLIALEESYSQLLEGALQKAGIYGPKA